MLTVRASSSQRSDRVTKRNPSETTTAVAMANPMTSRARGLNGGPSGSSGPDTASPSGGASWSVPRSVEPGPDLPTRGSPVPTSVAEAGRGRGGSATGADEGGAASITRMVPSPPRQGGVFCQFLGPFVYLAVTCPHDGLRLWQSAPVPERGMTGSGQGGNDGGRP